MHQIQSETVEQYLLPNIYLWLFLALGITALTTHLNEPFVVVNMWGLLQLLLPIFTTVALSVYLKIKLKNVKLKSGTAFILLTLCTLLAGLSLSPLFVVFVEATSAAAFFIAAATFGIMGVYGNIAKSNLQGFFCYLAMAILGLVLAFLVNFFFRIGGISALDNYLIVIILAVIAFFNVEKLALLAEEYKNSNQHTISAIS